MKIKYYFIYIILLIVTCSGCRDRSNGPYFATGIKIGEVTDNSAIIWIRLTSDSIPSGYENPLPSVKYINKTTGDTIASANRNRSLLEPVVSFPNGHTISTIQGSTVGVEGEVMIYYRPTSTQHWSKTEWLRVDPLKGHTIQVQLESLISNTSYEIQIISKYPDQKAIGETLTGHFKTAPDQLTSSDIMFTVTTGQAYRDMDIPGYGFKIYNSMLKLDPDFFVHTGDILYYDNLAKNVDLARWHWSRTYSLWTNYVFHRQVASYFMKDDHDAWMNDCWPGMESNFMGDFTFSEGQNIFLEQVPMKGKTYRTYRWGKDLQIWLMEGRDFRSPNTMEDGPEKTIWGAEQKSWLYETVKNSNASYKILISPTPIVGPDRKNKNDNLSNPNFKFEGDEVREFISSIPNMYVVCGDRHWQYISVDEHTGVREYSCGPASNEHAGGWSNEMVMPEHRYLNVTGGFLSGKVLSEGSAEPVLVMTHYSVAGEILNSDSINFKKVSRD